jgi:beta-xylosidase
VWAPCLRYHDGKFWIFYPDPDLGIFVTTAERFSGPWSAPQLLLPGKGIIDPTPLWDDDGKAWLLHGWAKSRAGINNLLTLRSMAPDASRLLDAEGRTIIDGNKLPGYRTLEGPKFYKHDGYYYVFAPAGGVEEGWQAVFRARSHRRSLRSAHRSGPGQVAHQRPAPGRLGARPGRQRLVPALPGQGRLWPRGAPAADALGGRLAGHRRRRPACRHRPAGAHL